MSDAAGDDPSLADLGLEDAEAGEEDELDEIDEILGDEPVTLERFEPIEADEAAEPEAAAEEPEIATDVEMEAEATEDEVVDGREGDELRDAGRPVVRALAEPDRAHLRERPDRQAQAGLHGLDPGDERGGDGAQAGEQDSQLAFRGRDVVGHGDSSGPMDGLPGGNRLDRS